MEEVLIDTMGISFNDASPSYNILEQVVLYFQTVMENSSPHL